MSYTHPVLKVSCDGVVQRYNRQRVEALNLWPRGEGRLLRVGAHPCNIHPRLAPGAGGGWILQCFLSKDDFCTSHIRTHITHGTHPTGVSLLEYRRIVVACILWDLQADASAVRNRNGTAGHFCIPRLVQTDDRVDPPTSITSGSIPVQVL